MIAGAPEALAGVLARSRPLDLRSAAGLMLLLPSLLLLLVLFVFPLGVVLSRSFPKRFPDLRGVRVTHCWSGLCALTADRVPHIGTEDGMHYLLGCCGTGVPMSTYLGHKVALKTLGEPDAASAFDRPLPAMPFWRASPYLIPIGVRLYALSDRLLH